jgi:tetratricopeptide (TPR) repeat protein
MAKKLNKNLVLGLAVLGFVITTAAGVAMVKFLQQTDPTEFAARADEFAESDASEDWMRAYQYYSRAFRASNDPHYLVRGADMLRKMGKEDDALRQYNTAVVLVPDLLDAQESILDLRLDLARMAGSATSPWMEVKATCEAVLDLDGQENHPRALYGMGAALLALRELSPENEVRGVEFLHRAIEAEPSAVEPARRLAQYFYAAQRDTEAGELIEKLAAANVTPGEDAAEAYALLANHCTRTGDFGRAAEMFAKAQSMAGEDKTVQARVHTYAGNFWKRRWSILEAQTGDDRPSQAEIDEARDSAIAAADLAIATDPQVFDGYFLRAELYRLADDVDNAIAVMQKRLELPFERTGFQSILTRWNRYILLIALADLHIAQAASEARGSEQMERLTRQARMYIEDAMGEFHERPEASHSRGKVAYVEGAYSEAVTWFERSDDQGGGNPVNLHYLSLARMRMGQLGGALEAIERAAAMPDASAAVLATYAQVLQRVDRPRDAISAAEVALSLDPNNAEAQMARAAAYEALGETSRVADVLKQIPTDRLDITVAKARFMASQGQSQEAIELLLGALERKPAEPQLVAAAAQVYSSMNRQSDARALIDAALTTRPDDFDLRLSKLQYSDLDDAKRREAYQELITTLPDEYDRVVRLAAVYAEDKDEQRVQQQLETAKNLIFKQATPAARLAGEPALRTIVDRLIELYTRVKDFEALDKLVAEAGTWNNGAGLDGAEGKSYRGRRILIDAYLAAQNAAEAGQKDDQAAAKRWNEQAQKSYREAIDALQLALDKFPTSGETYAQLGEAFLQTGRMAEARAAMEKANDLLPRNPVVLKRLTLICRRLGDEDAYRRLLGQCKHIIPDDPWVAEQLLIAEEEANPREGIARREELRASNPQDLQNLASLARLYHTVGDTGKAEECASAIIAVDEAGEFVAQTAALLRSIGKHESALSLLEQHLREAPNERKAEAQLLIADHYAAVADPRTDNAFLAAADIEANETVCLAIGQHFLRTGRASLAEEWFAKAQDLASASTSVRLPMIYQVRIDTALRLDQVDRARELCDAFKQRFADDPAGIFLDAEIYSAKGEVDAAIKTLTQYLERSGRVTDTLGDYRRKVALYRRAQLYRHQERWQDVINDLNGLVASDPTALDFKPRILLSMAYDKVGRPDAAVEELASVYRSNPEAANVVQELVDRYIRDGRFNDADRVLAAMLNHAPENVAWLVRSGDVAVEQNDRSKALANFKLAAKLSGYAPAVTNKLFNACLRFKLPEQGIEFFEKSIPPGQQDPEVILGHARMLAARGDAGNAVEMCRLALHRRGYDSFDFMRELAVSIHQMFGAGALGRFQTPLREPVFERANQHIVAMLHQFSGQMAEADVINQELLGRSTDAQEQSQIWFRIGLAHSDQNEPADAHEAYAKALEKDPNNLAALNNLAYILTEKLDKPKEAVAYARRAVNIATSRGTSASTVVAALDTLGWAHLCNKENRSAIAKLNQALDIDPNYIPATYHLAEAFRREGQFEPAESKYQVVIDMPPGSEFSEYLEKAREGLRKTQERQTD